MQSIVVSVKNADLADCIAGRYFFRINIGTTIYDMIQIDFHNIRIVTRHTAPVRMRSFDEYCGEPCSAGAAADDGG